MGRSCEMNICLHLQEDGRNYGMCHTFYVYQILERYNTIYSFLTCSINSLFIILMSSRCIIGEINISNAFSVTKILFDPTTEHVNNFWNMFIQSTHDHVLSRLIMHHKLFFILLLSILSCPVIIKYFYTVLSFSYIW